MPKVSILIPVHNAQDFLAEAVDSILNQTLEDFECIIIDDGSTDKSKFLIKKIKDKRVKKILHSKKQGIVKTLNEGIKIARGVFIARMDADDVSMPSRLKVQVDYLESHPQIGICGTWLDVFGIHDYVWKTETEHKFIQARALFETPIGHPTVMIRKNILTKYNLFYRAAYKYAEDYDLWVRAAKVTKFHCIPNALVKYRVHDMQTGQAKKTKQQDTTNKIRMRQLTDLGIPQTNSHQKIMAALGSWQPYSNYKQVRILLNQISLANSQKKLYDQQALDIILAERWLGMVSLHQKSPLKKAVLSLTPGLRLIIPSLRFARKKEII